MADALCIVEKQLLLEGVNNVVKATAKCLNHNMAQDLALRYGLSLLEQIGL
jgi:hypothetical protein